MTSPRLPCNIHLTETPKRNGKETMTYYVRTGNTYRIMNENDMEVSQKLESKTYSVIQHPMSGEFMLQPIKNFEMPSKIYGNTHKQAERILNTFESRPFTTGVHMDGVKGSGKSLLAKYVSVRAQEQGIPTIVINNPFCGEEFNKFIQSIDVPAVLLFDEFEKVYNNEHQNKILTLFDGVYPSKKLFLLTTNESYMVSNYLKNRPGRIYYSFKFDTLDPEFVREYCEDNLNDKSHVRNIVNYTNIFSFFNFDMLSSAVEEMNRYGESLQEVLGYLNIIPETKNSDSYMIMFEYAGKIAQIETSFNGFSPNNIEYYVTKDDLVRGGYTVEEIEKLSILFKIDNFDGSTEIRFDKEDIHSFDQSSNSFVYAVEEKGVKAKLLFKKNVTKLSYNFSEYGAF